MNAVVCGSSRGRWMAGLCAAFLSLLLFAGEAEVTEKAVSFEFSLPADAVTLPAGAYLVSGTILHEGKAIGAFYRIPRFTLPCRNTPCAVVVRCAVPVSNVTEALALSVIRKTSTMTFRSEFKNADTKSAAHFDIASSVTAQSIGLTPDSAAGLIRFGSPAFTPKTQALTLDLTVVNPFTFPVRLASIRVKAEPAPKSVTEQTFPFNEPIPPGEIEKTLSLPLKSADLLYLISNKFMQEDYTLSLSVPVEGVVAVRIAGQSLEIPFQIH